MAASLSFLSGVVRVFRALKHLIDKNKGTSFPSRWAPWLSFLATLERWKWFDMETRLTCSIFAMLSGRLTRTLGSCFHEGIGRFHFFPWWHWFPLWLPKLSEIQKPQPPSLSCLLTQISPPPASLLGFFTTPHPSSLKWPHISSISYFYLYYDYLEEKTLCA